MSNIGKTLITTRMYSLVAYILIRKLEGKDDDPTYEEELIDLMFDVLDDDTEERNLFMEVFAYELFERHYPYIQAHLSHPEKFVALLRENLQLEGLTFEECDKIVRPLYEYIVSKMNNQEESV